MRVIEGIFGFAAWEPPLEGRMFCKGAAPMVRTTLCCRPARLAFTLVEILIVTTMVLVLAGAVITQIGVSIEEVKESALQADLASLRKAIERYKLDHESRTPQWAAGSVPQLLSATDHRGNIGAADAQHPFGPYLLGDKLPVNPITESNVVTLIATKRPTAYQAGGWLYHEASGRITADRRTSDVAKLALEAPEGP
jgi:type II secretory pathway pseudopilin PulG